MEGNLTIEVETGYEFRTLILKGREGKPIGRFHDGRVVVFSDLPAEFKFGQIAHCKVVKVSPTYLAARIEKVTVPEGSELEILTRRPKAMTMLLDLELIGAKGYAFRLPKLAEFNDKVGKRFKVTVVFPDEEKSER